MALTKIKGQNFRVFEGDPAAAVVEATNCTVTISGSTEDSSTKDSEAGFAQETITEKSWQVQVESFDASAARIKALLSRMLALTAIDIGFDQTATTAGSQNRTPVGAPFARSGKALLTDLSIVANNRQTITVTEQYTGNGALSADQS